MDRRTTAASLVLACLTSAALLYPAGALAFESPNDPSSGMLVDAPKSFDGEQVVFEGEAIGEAMRRGQNAWIHLNDDAYMYKNVEEGAELGGFNSGMPVWLPAAEARKITTFGDYKHEGDVVRITGVFNAACAQHGGDMDIHAFRLEVRIPGRPAADPVKPWKLPVAGLLAVGAALAFAGERRLGSRELTGLFRRG